MLTSRLGFILRAIPSTILFWTKLGQRCLDQDAGTVDVAAQNPGEVSEDFCQAKFSTKLHFSGWDNTADR